MATLAKSRSVPRLQRYYSRDNLTTPYTTSPSEDDVPDIPSIPFLITSPPESPAIETVEHAFILRASPPITISHSRNSSTTSARSSASSNSSGSESQGGKSSPDTDASSLSGSPPSPIVLPKSVVGHPKLSSPRSFSRPFAQSPSPESSTVTSRTTSPTQEHGLPESLRIGSPGFAVTQTAERVEVHRFARRPIPVQTRPPSTRPANRMSLPPSPPMPEDTPSRPALQGIQGSISPISPMTPLDGFASINASMISRAREPMLSLPETMAAGLQARPLSPAPSYRTVDPNPPVPPPRAPGHTGRRPARRPPIEFGTIPGQAPPNSSQFRRRPLPESARPFSEVHFGTPNTVPFHATNQSFSRPPVQSDRSAPAPAARTSTAPAITKSPSTPRLRGPPTRVDTNGKVEKDVAGIFHIYADDAFLKRRGLNIVHNDKTTPAYYAELKSKEADIVVRRPTKDGMVVGRANFPDSLRYVEVEFPAAGHMTRMTREGGLSKAHSFTLAMDEVSAEGELMKRFMDSSNKPKMAARFGSGSSQHFLWKGTRQFGGSWTGRSIKLVDDSGRVYAAFACAAGRSKAGRLIVFVHGLKQVFLDQMIVSCIALLENEEKELVEVNTGA